jgi:hypothetical protein
MPDKTEKGTDLTPPVEGPVVESPTQDPPAPEGVKVTIMGREFTVDPELASTIDEREKAHAQKLSERSEELGILRQKEEERIKPEKPSYGDLIFSDPDGFAKGLTEDITKQVVGVVTNMYQREQFWNMFYSSNPDLKRSEHHYLAEATLNRNWDKWKGISAEEGAKALSMEVRKMLGKSPIKPTKTTVKTKEELHTETPASGFFGLDPTKGVKKPEGHKTMSQVIREQRARKNYGK